MNAAELVPVPGWEAPVRRVEITREKIATYSRRVFGGRDTRNIHTDDEVARRAGLPRALAQGRYPIAYLTERMVDLFGTDFLQGGRIEVALVRPIYPGDTLDVCARVRSLASEGDGARVEMEVWLQNQHGERVTAGTASAPRRSQK